MPTVDLSANVTAVLPGKQMVVKAAIADGDAASTNNPALDYELLLEWRDFCNGQRINWVPASQRVKSDKFKLTALRPITFPRAHIYEVRLDVSDEWHSWATHQMIVEVSPDLDKGLYVNGFNPGTKPGKFAQHDKDVVDTAGRCWLHLQQRPALSSPIHDKRLGSTWTYEGSRMKYLTSTQAVAGTNDDKLFQTAVASTAQDFDHVSAFKLRVPASTGRYKVRLGFADMWSKAPGQRKTSVRIEQEQVLSNFDVYAEAGAKTAIFKEFTVQVDDGILNINLVKGKGSKAEGFVNCIEIKRVGGTTPSPVRSIVMENIPGAIWFIQPMDGKDNATATTRIFDGLLPGTSYRLKLLEPGNG